MKGKFNSLLNWASKKSKTDMAYVADRGSWVFANQAISAISALTVTVVLANLLSQESFGQYRFVLAAIAILSIFTLPGSATSMIRSVAKGNKVNFDQVAKTRINWGLLGSIASLALTLYYQLASNNVLAYAFLVTAIFLPAYETFLLYSYYYKGKEDFKKSTIYESSSRIIQAIALIVTALFTKSVIVLILVFFLGKLATNLFFYLKTKNEEAENILSGREFDKSDDTISYGKHLTAIGILGILTTNIDKLFIWHFIGDKELAIYYIALVIPINIVLFLNVMSRISFPRFSKASWSKERYRALIKKIFVYLIILIFPALIYAIIAPWLIPLLFKSYSGSIFAALIFSALIILAPVNAIIAQMLRATKKIKQIILLRVLVIISYSAIFLLYFDSLGILASAIALIASELLIFLLGTLLLNKEAKLAS